VKIDAKGIQAKRTWKNPSCSELREWARKDELTTEYGSASYITKVRNRSPKNTFIVDAGFPIGIRQETLAKDKADALARDVRSYLADKEVVEVNRTMCMSDYTLACRLTITKPYARIAYLWHTSLFPPQEGREPDLTSIYVPEWPERVIFSNPRDGYTYILGTDYFGEAKKSFLRKAMYHIKQRGGIGLHAGSKVLRARGPDGKVRDVGLLLFGLSGTGKTTLTMHDHELRGEEGVAIRQDDVVLMRRDGYCYGTEDGFFIKTEGLEPSQRVLWNAATKPDAAFENIWVEKDGKVDFLNYTLTTNGRGIVRRCDIEGSDDRIDLPKAHKTVFITRRDDVVPMVARLDAVQAGAYFMLGESIETSAGDPTKVGRAKREVGTNPFIVGPESEEGHRIVDILSSNPDMECYLLNTGRIGKSERDEGRKIGVRESIGVLREIARDSVSWERDPDWGYEVAMSVPGIETEKFNPRSFYSAGEYEALVEKLRRERVEWLAQFPGLDSKIQKAVEKTA
jgi:phosphoenolpyruvate carboxykinase (ATP)